MTEEAGQYICPEPRNFMTRPATYEVAQREDARDVDDLAGRMQATSIRAPAYSQDACVAEQPAAMGVASPQAPAYAWPYPAGTSCRPAQGSDPGISSSPSALWGDGYAGGWQDTAPGEEENFVGQPAVS